MVAFFLILENTSVDTIERETTLAKGWHEWGMPYPCSMRQPHTGTWDGFTLQTHVYLRQVSGVWLLGQVRLPHVRSGFFSSQVKVIDRFASGCMTRGEHECIYTKERERERDVSLLIIAANHIYHECIPSGFTEHSYGTSVTGIPRWVYRT